MGGDQPKTLTPVGGNETLLHYILAGLRIAGITDVLVVTGHGRDDLQTAVIEEWGPDNVTFIFNGRYASWGNFHSVRIAVDQSPGTDLLVVNSDVVVPPDVYRRVAAVQGDLVLAVQRREGLELEDMRVELRQHQVVAIGKHLKMVKSHGEYAGVSLLRPRAFVLPGEYAEIDEPKDVPDAGAVVRSHADRWGVEPVREEAPA